MNGNTVSTMKSIDSRVAQVIVESDSFTEQIENRSRPSSRSYMYMRDMSRVTRNGYSPKTMKKNRRVSWGVFVIIVVLILVCSGLGVMAVLISQQALEPQGKVNYADSLCRNLH